MRLRLTLLVVTAFLLATEGPASGQALDVARVWYAKELREHFPNGVPIHGYTHPIDEIGVSPVDVTHFEIVAETVPVGSESILRVSGTLRIDPLPTEVRTFLKPRYMIRLQAYLFSPDGSLIWTQHGFPQGDSWIGRSGGVRRLRLANDLRTPVGDAILIILALGDPLLMDGVPDAYVILGIKKLVLSEQSLWE